MSFTCKTFRHINTLTPAGAHAKSQHLVRSRAVLTTILADFNGVSVQTGVSHHLWLAPDDRDRGVIFILDEQIQRSAGGLWREQTLSQSSDEEYWIEKRMQEIRRLRLIESNNNQKVNPRHCIFFFFDK